MPFIFDVNPLTSLNRDEWIERVNRAIPIKWRQKFENGRIAHDGDLGEIPLMNLLDEMENEALDQLSYIYELKRRVRQTAADSSASSKIGPVGT